MIGYPAYTRFISTFYHECFPITISYNLNTFMERLQKKSC